MQVSVQFDENGRDILAMYFEVSTHKIAKTVEFSNAVNIDFDRRGEMVGVEVLNPDSLSALMDIAEIYKVPELKQVEKVLEKTFA